MKKNLKQFGIGTIVMLSLCLGKLAIAGERGGNGGDVVVCPDRINMLDSVESTRRKQPVSINATEEGLRAKLDLLLSRVKKKDNILEKELKTRVEILYKDVIKYDETGETEQENIIFTDGDLVNVADEGATYIPTGCKIEQLIIQTKSPMPGDKKFLFQKNLWNRMDITEKSVAIFHEAIYSYLLDNGINDSQATRFYNGMAISAQLDKLQDKAYHQTISDIGFPKKPLGKFGLFFELKGPWSIRLNAFVDNVTYNSDGSVAKINVAVFPAALNYIKGTKAKATVVEEIEIKGDEWVKLRITQSNEPGVTANYDYTLSTYYTYSMLGDGESLFELNSMKEIKLSYAWGRKKLWGCTKDSSILEGTIISTGHYPKRKRLMLSRVESGYQLTGANHVTFKRDFGIGSLDLDGCRYKMTFNDVGLNLDADFNVLSLIE